MKVKREKDDTTGYNAPALEKGLDILEVLSKSENGLTQQEIATKLDRKLSEFYRMLTCLVQRSYEANNGNTYHLTPKLFQLSHFHPPTYRLLTEGLPIMEELSRKISFPCDIRVYNKGLQTVIASIQPPNGLGFVTRVGSEIEVAPSASGMVLLAFQDPLIQEIWIKESLKNKYEAEIREFKRSLLEISSKGYASIQSNQFAGLHAIAFPILDSNGFAIAAITVPMLERIDGTLQMSKEEVKVHLRESVSNLNRKLNITT